MFDKPPRARGLALDRASVRKYDQDGRLRIATSHISKANVSEYFGKEIPGHEELGLDPNGVYKLLRDPEELRKAVDTFNSLPILDHHVPVSATMPRQDIVIGSTGTDAVFKNPYLDNSLVFWVGDAILDLENDERKELSCAYHYEVDMTPGTFEGEKYDGVMRNIRGNHVALVPIGRAGPDIVVGDSNPEGFMASLQMLSRKASFVKGALLVFTPPLLAADAKPNFGRNLNKILTGVASGNWRNRKSSIAEAIRPMLAQDASMDQLVSLLDNLDGDEPMDADVGVDTMPGQVPVDNTVTADVDPMEEFMMALKPMLMKLMGKTPAMDNPPGGPGQPAPPVPAMEPGADPMDDPKKKEPPMAEATPGAPAAPDKKAEPAMDAATVRKIQDETIARIRATTEAVEAVQPYVGKLAIACDSAEAVYRAALTTMGVDLTGVHPSAFRAILNAHPKPGTAPKQIAQDSAKLPDGFAARFPDFNRVRVSA
jgi:hypothetical protein